MKRAPRAASSTLFSSALVAWGLVQGAVALVALTLLYWLALYRGMPEADVRALTFVALVLVDLGLVLVNRSFGVSPLRAESTGNHALWWVSGVTLALLTVVLVWPEGRELFRLAPLHAGDLTAIAAVVVAVVAVLEILKRFWRTPLAS
jgi:Ca2+-transporting ATPase